jgi:malate synthase
LYDALYGTDVISEEKGCEKAIEKGKSPLQPQARQKGDRIRTPCAGPHRAFEEGLAHGSTGYRIKGGKLVVTLKDGNTSKLANKDQFIGYQGEAKDPTNVLLQHNGLHIDIIINRSTPIGKSDAAGVSDLVLEAALSTILDLEDSVAVVDADDKVLAYSNWLGILNGTLTESFEKGGKTLTRGLNADRVYTAAQAARARKRSPCMAAA